MSPSLEIKAFGLALLAALFALGVAWLIAMPIHSAMAGVSTHPAGPPPAPLELPPVTAELLEQGHKAYIISCSDCHAEDATGDEGPDLHNLSMTNAHIASVIKKGIKGEMPSFAKKYDDAQVAAIVLYLRSLK